MKGLLLLGVFLVAGPAAAQNRLDRRIAISPDASIRVLNLVGSIRVIGWDHDSLAVTGRLAPGAGKFFYFGGGNRAAKLGIEPPEGVEPGESSDLEVRVPLRAKLWIKAATAEIEVSNFSGGLDLYSVSGSIRVSGTPAQVYAESMDGNIVVEGSPPWMRLKTASGSITLRGGEDVAATTVSGSIQLTGAKLVRGRFESVTGDIRYDGDIERGSSLTAESHSGVIELRLPGTVSAEFDISEFQGDIVNELTRAVPIPARERGGKKLVFTVGQGGADVTIRNFKGPVLLRKKK